MWKMFPTAGGRAADAHTPLNGIIGQLVGHDAGLQGSLAVDHQVAWAGIKHRLDHGAIQPDGDGHMLRGEAHALRVRRLK
jgi:hypothetical protein